MFRLRAITTAAVSALIATVAFAGCGSSGDSGFPDNGGNPNGNPNGNGDPGTGGGVRGDIDGGGTGNPGNNPGDVGPVENCATQTAQSTLSKVNLITMFDRSGSMGNGTSAGDNYRTRWAPVTKAMKAFYSDQKSSGMNASLAFFPIVADQNGNSVCATQFYQLATVPITALPSSKFSDAIDDTDPGGGTPTEAALQGAVDFTKETQKNRPAEKSVILLVTDGQPNHCSSTSDDPVKGVVNVASKARQSSPAISTYVIGVGGDDAALYAAVDKMAAAGGTQGIHVDTKDPEQTSANLVAQLQKIRNANLSCSFGIPTPPGGGQINYDAVRVNFKPSSAAAKTIPYNESCSGNEGWHYDNKAAPKQIVLCTNSCNTIQGDPGGKINIAFDCRGSAADGGTGGGPVH